MLALLYASSSGDLGQAWTLIGIVENRGERECNHRPGEGSQGRLDHEGRGHPESQSRSHRQVLVRLYLTLSFQTDSITDTSREQLRTIQSTRTYPDPKVLNDLKKRKLVKMQKVISYKFSKGPKFAREFVKEETDLTADMLAR